MSECDAAVDARLGAAALQSWGWLLKIGDGHGDGHGGGRRRQTEARRRIKLSSRVGEMARRERWEIWADLLQCVIGAVC